MKHRPMFSRILVFTPTNHKKIGSGLLYSGNYYRGTKTALQLAAVIECGPHCHEPLPMGTMCVVQDGMEFIDTPLNLWDDYKDTPCFAELAQYQRETECDVHTKLLQERSLLAVWEGFKASDRLITGSVMHHFGD